VGGKQNVGQTQRAIGKYNFLIIDEQSIIIFIDLFCHNNAMQMITK
jgi:hypothetical protein